MSLTRRPMTLRALTLACSLSLTSCGSGTGPHARDMNGIYSGTYTVSTNPQLVHQGAMQIIQTGDSVRGTTDITAGRWANVYGFVVGHFIAIRLALNDTCGGSGTTFATIAEGGHLLTGEYSVSGGCGRPFNGRYRLTRP